MLKLEPGYAQRAGIAQYSRRCRRLEKRKADMIVQARNKPKPGALQKQLDAQKRMTDKVAMKALSDEEILQRNAEATRRELMHD